MRTAAQVTAEANRVMDVAVAEFMEQRANGWTTPEIAVCMVDAAELVAGLRRRAAGIVARRRKPVTA